MGEVYRSPVDIFGSVMKYVWGHDAHNGVVFTTGTI